MEAQHIPTSESGFQERLTGGYLRAWREYLPDEGAWVDTSYNTWTSAKHEYRLVECFDYYTGDDTNVVKWLNRNGGIAGRVYFESAYVKDVFGDDAIMIGVFCVAMEDGVKFPSVLYSNWVVRAESFPDFTLEEIRDAFAERIYNMVAAGQVLNPAQKSASVSI